MNFMQNAKVHVTNMSPYQTAKPLSSLNANGMGAEMINLASNENPFPPSKALQGLLQDVHALLHRYPDPTGIGLKKQLAAHLLVEPEQITLCNGSSEAISLLVQLFAGLGDEVIVADTAYALYETCIKTQGAQAKKIPDQNWVHDLSAMQKSITTKTKLILLANPNNPTGTFFKHEHLQSFLESISEEIIVVLDEAYFDYIDDGSYPKSLLLQQTYNNLVITRSFSKAYALAGLRIGYCLAHPKLSDLLNRIRLSFNVNTIALEAAKIALHQQVELQETVSFVKAERQKLQSELTRLGISYIPGCANFILMHFPDKANHIFQQLLNQGILIRQLRNYRLPDHLRVSMGTTKENQRFIQALARILS